MGDQTVTKYVAGFLIDCETDRVLLIRKNRPAWQAGKLNGIGGHIEDGETALQAMCREFREEAGLDLAPWYHFATVYGDWGSVQFFRLFTNYKTFSAAEQKTDEELVAVPLGLPRTDVIPNLSFLLPLANYRHDFFEPVLFTEDRNGNG